ncbi:hypothetical protein BKA70DRAFT_1412047, partial [Coprinopsis sp. MPI-PUGE-AT-0042]
EAELRSSRLVCEYRLIKWRCAAQPFWRLRLWGATPGKAGTTESAVSPFVKSDKLNQTALCVVRESESVRAGQSERYKSYSSRLSIDIILHSLSTTKHYYQSFPTLSTQRLTQYAIRCFDSRSLLRRHELRTLRRRVRGAFCPRNQRYGPQRS